MIFGTSTCWVILSHPSKKKRSPIEIRGQFNFLYLKLFILIPVKSVKTLFSLMLNLAMENCTCIDTYNADLFIHGFFLLHFSIFCPKGQKGLKKTLKA